MTIPEALEKYRHDPTFHNLVNQFHSLIHFGYPSSNIQEAVGLALILEARNTTTFNNHTQQLVSNILNYEKSQKNVGRYVGEPQSTKRS